MLALAGCAAPTYTYRFAPSPYLEAISKNTRVTEQAPVAAAEETPLLVAATEAPAAIIAPPAAPAGKKINKTIRKVKDKVNHLGEQVVVKTRLMEPPAPGSVDTDLKYAIVLGAAGIVALLLLVLSKVFGIIGGIALIAATIFFAKWILAQ